MVNTYIFDTSVVISDPYAIKSFDNAEIVLPVALLDEVDKLKKFHGEVGKNARVFIRLLDEISEMGDISVGVMLDNETIVRVDTTTYPNDFGDRLHGDTHILACAYNINKKKEATLLTNDINLRVRGRALGLMCDKYNKVGLATSELYAGVQYIKNTEAGTKLSSDGFLMAADYNLELNLNECIVFTNEHGAEISKGRMMRKGKIKAITTSCPWGLVPRNGEQEMLVDLILDPKISLITVAGNAGTGKTLCTLACALELVLHKKAYSKTTIYRPIQSVGEEIGFLPGSLIEKISVHFGAIMDSFEVLLSNNTKQGADWKRDLEMFQKKGRIEMDAITFVRGRSLPNTLIICDEAQNLEPKDIKTLLTRAGDGSKIILLGDIEQIDNDDLDASNNGLTNVIEKFKGWDQFAHITLVQGERSILASKAAELL